MTMVDDSASPDADYRRSHVAKGASYDAKLAESPFDAYMSAWEARHVPSMVRTCFPSGPERYLDFACGTGRITQLIAPLARTSVAVDISPTMIEQARRKCPDTEFFLADITRDALDIGQFDLVSSFRFFGNAQDELREAALQAIARRTRKGGHLLINSHRNPRAIYALLDRMSGGDAGQMDLPLAKLRALLRRNGFEIVRLQPIGAWMYRARQMVKATPEDARSVCNERRFGLPALAAIAPDVIVLAVRR